MSTIQNATSALREINDQQHTEYELGDQPAGGMTRGAWRVYDPNGNSAILKLGSGFSLDHLRRADQAVKHLRANGYPTPAWLGTGKLADGTRYHLQERLPGEPGDPLTADKARQLVTLLASHQGLDPWPERDWNQYVHETYDHAKRELRRKAPASKDLVDRIDRLHAALGSVELPKGDLVHGDFNSCNVLFHHGQLTGVIDIEALGGGSRVIDHAYLYREAHAEGSKDPEIFHTIRTAGEAVAGKEAFAYCVAFNACEWLLWMAIHLPDSVNECLGGLHRLIDDVSQPTKPVW
ncbi:phosphotransferase enzyme family protein [Tenggerimyces flavus]|uniref:Phosphotransferase enzyme family protein n=1 Tax=Tenggerimyces flavus TaxID=1708749 RepID=A0ABV7YGC4_9ACTN|nr:phosphotransferase [Tenggerimyces flavus]MBM7784186.1 aminoglycoside phosphotransferase (APT) family kinase protein [Tenggerimyces flavus]